MNTTVILQLGRMGDMLQTVPLLLALKARTPDADVKLACVAEFSAALAAFGLQRHCVGIPAQQVQALRSSETPDAALLDTIMSASGLDAPCDLCINCNHDAGTAALATRITASRRGGRSLKRTGLYIQGDWGRYLFAFGRQRSANLINMADLYCGLAGVRPSPQTLPLAVSTESQAEAAGLLASDGIDDRTPIIGLQLGASAGYRSWRVEEFVALANRLIERGVGRLVITGGPNDRELARTFIANVDGPVVDTVGRTTLQNLPALLARCGLLITNDTGPMHLAALTGTRILSIHCASAYFAETAAYAAGNVLVHAAPECYPCFPSTHCGEMSCKRAITPALVERLAAAMLAGQPISGPDEADVGVYTTRFLGNGLLGYAPCAGRVPQHLIQGFVNHMVWEPILGIEPDPAYNRAMFDAITADPTTAAIRASVSRRLDRFSASVKQCAEQLDLLAAELKRSRADAARIRTIFASIKRIEEEISSHQEGALPFFHLLEATTMEGPNPVQTVHALRALYHTRMKQLNAARAALEKFA
jgi:ADP-heptose:LPS heptosyltransferase